MVQQPDARGVHPERRPRVRAEVPVTGHPDDELHPDPSEIAGPGPATRHRVRYAGDPAEAPAARPAARRPGPHRGFRRCAVPADRDPLEVAEERIAEARRAEATSLNLSWLGLTEVPESVGDLPRLTRLDLAGNRLTALPAAVGDLARLETLELRGNRLTAVPDAVRRLARLARLNLSHNQLSALPPFLLDLPQLQVLHLHNNPALGLPPEVLGPTPEQSSRANPVKPPREVLDYYFRTREAARPLNEGKIILVGRGEVGKTSLVKRLVHNTFTVGEPITHGINITRWQGRAGADTITLHVWDFGGQEIMHGTHQFFLTERSLYLLVLNGRQGKEEEEAEYWLNLIRSCGGDSPVIVVLNKQGQHPFDVDRASLVARFPQVKGFVRTDCQDDTGIDELRKAVARAAVALPNLRAKFPVSWFAIKDRLGGMSESYIGYGTYAGVCAELGEPDPAGQDRLAAVLHDLGIALNYRDDPRLSDTHVLNPRWVTGGIYAVITARLVAAQHGTLNPGDLANILDPAAYPRGMHRFLTDLMRKFDVLFAVPDDSGTHLVPNLLDRTEPPGVPAADAARALNFEYRYAVLPEGLLPRFLARTHWYSDGRPRWRTGVVLGFDGCEAVVRGDAAGRKVTVRVTGPEDRRRGLLTLIRSEFDRLHREFKANPPEAWVPLPGFPDAAVRFDELQVLEAEGESHVTAVVDRRRHRFAIAELLNGLGVVRSRAGRRAKRVFVSYSHRDETHKATLGGHLLQLVQEGLVEWWDDRHLRPADDWAGEIDRTLDTADLVLLLVSRNFLASRYCTTVEVPRALERRDREGVRVLPIVLDESELAGQPFMTRQALPAGAKPVLSPAHWPDPNDAWRQVADRLRSLVV
ncbi:MAG: serine/threonine protein kinase [Isosphaera sp.]|nr:serine/threonine protein kinase [Isosphaera sp.]